MKREIKFRVWHNGEMYNRWDKKGEIIIRNGGYVILEMPSTFPLQSGELVGLDRAILMQYTGLKDKNYKDIYEGDVCNDRVGEAVQVFWNDELARFEFKSVNENEDYQDSMDSDCKYWEVIGNIYENPELLNGDVSR